MFYEHKVQNESVEIPSDQPLVMYIDLDTLTGTRPGVTGDLSGSEESLGFLRQYADIYILSDAPWGSYRSWYRMADWLKQHHGDAAGEGMIFTDHMELLKGDYLVTCSYSHGSFGFEGKLIMLGSVDFPDWYTIDEYLRKMVLYGRRGYNHERPAGYPKQMLIEAFAFTKQNEDSVKRSRVCGCMQCGYRFDPRIESKLMYTHSGSSDLPGTLCCPRCGEHAVIGSASGYPAGERRFLEACRDLEHSV